MNAEFEEKIYHTLELKLQTGNFLLTINEIF